MKHKTLVITDNLVFSRDSYVAHAIHCKTITIPSGWWSCEDITLWKVTIQLCGKADIDINYNTKKEAQALYNSITEQL